MNLNRTVQMPEQKRERHSVNLPKKLAEAIKAIANREDRNFSQQSQTLIKEALARRKAHVSVEAIKALLSALTNNELTEVITEAAKLLGIRLSKFQPANPFAEVIQANFKTCSMAFDSMPGGQKRLQEIIEGAKPTEEELVVLDACIPMETEDLLNLFYQVYGNAATTDGKKLNGSSCK